MVFVATNFEGDGDASLEELGQIDDTYELNFPVLQDKDSSFYYQFGNTNVVLLGPGAEVIASGATAAELEEYMEQALP